MEYAANTVSSSSIHHHHTYHYHQHRYLRPTPSLEAQNQSHKPLSSSSHTSYTTPTKSTYLYNPSPQTIHSPHKSAYIYSIPLEELSSKVLESVNPKNAYILLLPMSFPDLRYILEYPGILHVICDGILSKEDYMDEMV